MKTKKFMQTTDKLTYGNLEEASYKRGITVQQLIRAVIVPDWLENKRERDYASMLRRKKAESRKRGKYGS